MFVLDTNVVSELRKARHGKADVHVVDWADRAEASTLYISAIERKDARQGAALRAWLDDQVLVEFKDRVLAIDTAVAQRCAGLHVPDRRAERDALIAATALVHGMMVVTRNVNDFVSTGARIANPWEPYGS